MLTLASEDRPQLPAGPYLVAGLGRAGLAVASRLAALPGRPALVGWDAERDARTLTAARELERHGVRAVLGGDGVALLTRAPQPRCVIKSPGIPFTDPLMVAARRIGLPVLDEAELAWRLDRRPHVAVTGTNGKGTTAALVEAVLGAAGVAAVAGGNMSNAPPLSALWGTPQDVVVAELSSFQLEGCTELRPLAAVLTNLTHDHLYRHGSHAAYAAAKRSLFIRGGRCVPAAAIGVDQPFGRELARDLETLGGRVVRFGIHPGAQYRVVDASWTLGSSVVSVATPSGSTRVLHTRLPGMHNAVNAAGALALADAVGIDVDLAARAVGSAAPVAGRFEVVDTDAPFDVVVDYAHNPQGVIAVLDTARSLLAARSRGSLIAVLSAYHLIGADQARAMGRAASERADELVLTTQRWTLHEPVGALAPGLAEGAALGRAAVGVVPDRAEAIAGALSRARAEDIVLIMGRGDIASALFDGEGRSRRFDDRTEARASLRAALAGRA